MEDKFQYPGDEFKEFEGQELENICFSTCAEHTHTHLTFRFKNGRMLHIAAETTFRAFHPDRPVMVTSKGTIPKVVLVDYLNGKGGTTE